MSRRFSISVLCFAAVAAVVAAVIGAGRPHVFAAVDATDGAGVYAVRCAICHQANGLGAGPYPPLAADPNVTTSDTRNLIATVVDGHYEAYRAPMPTERQALSDVQIAAVLTYVRSAWGNHAAAISPEQVAAAAHPPALSGAAIFASTCSSCHPRGAANGSTPPLDGNPHVTAADPKTTIVTIVNGMSGPLSVNGKTYDAVMPSWQSQLSNADVAAVATYIRSAWSNHASAVSEEEVAAAGAAVSAVIGKWIYAQVCASCHGAQGAAPADRMLAGNIDLSVDEPKAIIGTVKFGKRGMPSWRGQLSDADIASVLTYIRTAWGNAGGPVTAAEVHRLKHR